MLSNGRCIGSAGRLSGADMENAYSGMQQQRTDKTGVLPAAWDLCSGRAEIATAGRKK